MEDLLGLYERKSKQNRRKMAKSHTEEYLSAKESGAVHDTYQFENMMLSCIRDGEPEQLKRLFQKAQEMKGFTVGRLAATPLRQEKNLLIGLVAVVGKVAGIGGGMEIEEAYRLIDLYTQECEKAETVEAVDLLRYQMVMDFTERVQQAKLPSNVSPAVFRAMQYIGDHTNAPIALDDVAAHVGMSRSNLTRRFKAETGKTVNEYIIETKIRDAKRLLRYSDMTYGEIAAILAFSSQAYFQTVFKRKTGFTPGEYQTRHSKEQNTGNP